MNYGMSVVIPCIPKHYKYIYDLLDSINNQTLLPNEIIIALSSTLPSNRYKIENELKEKYPALNIILSIVEKEAYAGENRNRGASKALFKYITFIDADDLMCNYKIEKLMELFKNNHNIEGLLHTVGNKDVTYHLIGYDNVEKVCNTSVRSFLNNKRFNIKNIIHHGHLTIQKKIIDEYKQCEEMKRGQDSEYIFRLIKNKIKIFIYDDVLSIYRVNLSSTK